MFESSTMSRAAREVCRRMGLKPLGWEPLNSGRPVDLEYPQGYRALTVFHAWGEITLTDRDLAEAFEDE